MPSQPSVPVLTLTVRHQLSDVIMLPTRARFRYDPRDPYAVSLAVDNLGGTPACWLIGRDLLHSGLHRSVGEGDLQLRPLDGKSMLIRLRTRTRETVLVVGVRAVRRWLRRCYALVPPGSESEFIDWDALFLDTPQPHSDT